MSIPDISELESAARDVVRKAKKEGNLRDLTPRIIRDEVEARFSLIPGALNSKEYKHVLKQAAKEAVGEDNLDIEADKLKHSGQSGGVKKRKSDTHEESEAENHSNKKSKTSSTSPERDGSQGTRELNAKKKNRTKFKSSEMVLSSDAEKTDIHASCSKEALRSSTDSEGENEEEDDTKANGSSHIPPEHTARSGSSPDTTNHERQIPPQSSSNSIGATHSKAISDNPDNESELSDLIDEPPTRTKKRKIKKESKKSSDASTKKPRKSSVELSKDEKTIARLKSLVSACGVRKVWTKEFQHLLKSSQQVKRLKEILSGLGMNGRFTMQQAKSIKEQREWAQELEDVKAFEESVVSGPTRTRSKAKPAETESTPGERDSEAEEALAKRKPTARMSIMAFLGDESDDE